LLTEQGVEGPIIIGRDTRISGSWLAAAAAAGFCSAGRKVLDGGVLPTPAVSFLVRHHKAALGMVLSASHNPAPDNGLKFFASDGGKVSEEFEAAIEARLEKDPVPEQGAITGGAVGSLDSWPTAEREYADALIAEFSPALNLCGWKILFDGAHGASYRTSPQVLRGLGATVETLHCEPNGININEDCGALHPEIIQEKVCQGGFDLGILHDGDADRGFLVDGEGALLDGEDILYILSTHTSPRPSVVVGTVMSNLGAEKRLAEHGVQLIRTPVGDRNVRQAMVEHGAPFGAEPSGHVIVEALGPTGDGLASCLAVLRAVGGKKEALTSARKEWARYPQILENLKVGSKPPLEDINGYDEVLAKVEVELKGRGRVLVRYSGTEPKVRVMVEAEEHALARKAVDELKRFLSLALT
jgi:phosphoglucosamine mutase